MTLGNLGKGDVTRFKGRLPQVSVIRGQGDDADIAGTEALLNQYTDETGFHCPRCGVTITNPDKAIEHLGEEINEAFRTIGLRKAPTDEGVK